MSEPNEKHPVGTRLCRSTEDDVFVRGESLTKDLMGKLSFTEMMFFQILGRRPTAGERAVLDASLVAIMEHGLTPTAIVARMTYTSAPESLQGAVAAGLASVGSLFVGTMEGCAKLLTEIVAADDGEVRACEIVRRHADERARLPGFGHPIHRPDDPRTEVLLTIAREHGVAGEHVRALETLSRVLDEERGAHLTINATGAIAAVLSDIGVPAEIMRGFAVVSRAAGLVGHIHEEQNDPAMHAMWMASESAVPHQTTKAEKAKKATKKENP